MLILQVSTVFVLHQNCREAAGAGAPELRDLDLPADMKAVPVVASPLPLLPEKQQRVPVVPENNVVVLNSALEESRVGVEERDALREYKDDDRVSFLLETLPLFSFCHTSIRFYGYKIFIELSLASRRHV